MKDYKYEVTVDFKPSDIGNSIASMTFKRETLEEAKKVYNKYLNAWINDKDNDLNIAGISIEELF